MREFLLYRFCQFLLCLGHVLTLREDVSDKPQTRTDFLVPTRGTHKSPKIVCGLRTRLRSVQNLERHGSSQLAKAAELEIPYFVIRILPPVFRWNAGVKFFNEQQRSGVPLPSAACLALPQLFVLYEHLFDDALAVGADFFLRLFIQLVRIDRLAVL